MMDHQEEKEYQDKLYVSISNKYLFLYIYSIQGEKGMKGEKGSDGPIGDKGDRGPNVCSYY